MDIDNTHGTGNIDVGVPQSNPYFKITPNSRMLNLDLLIARELVDPNRVARAKILMEQASTGVGEKRNAILRGYIESKGGKVIAATVLTGKQYSAKIALNRTKLQEVRNKHGKELENWWQERFGHTFDSLTQSEARYLLKTENADRIRNKIVTAEQV